MSKLHEKEGYGVPILLPPGIVRKIGAIFLIIGVIASVILTLRDIHATDVIPTAWLGYLVTVVSLSLILFPRMWQIRISRRR